MTSNHNYEQIEIVHIKSIEIIGNKRTKDDIILREISITTGATYSKIDLEKTIDSDRNMILNTKLFNSVTINIVPIDRFSVSIVIIVKERWYTFPIPIINIADRNINDWWQNRMHEFNRLNYGVKIIKNNIRGRNENLILLLQFGFIKKLGVMYQIPYLDKNKRSGLKFTLNYTENNSIATHTLSHIPVFHKKNKVIKMAKNYGITYFIRKLFYNTHSASIFFNDKQIDDNILEINPNYFINKNTSQKYFELIYNFRHEKLDFVSYPLEGRQLSIKIRKEGIGFYNSIEQTNLNINYTKYYALDKKMYISNYLSVCLSSPDKQPYSNMNALGYNNDFIRGYELYVIEGKNYYINRSTIKKQFFSKVTKVGFIPVEQFKTIPIDIYYKLYVDLGYVENFPDYENNSLLSNTFLAGIGTGIDFVTYYDTVIRLEFSANIQKQTGFYLHFSKEF